MTRDTGLSRYDDDDEEAYDTNDTSGKGPSAGLRVAADMEMIGQEYHGKRVSRKKLEASSGAFGKCFSYIFLLASRQKGFPKKAGGVFGGVRPSVFLYVCDAHRRRGIQGALCPEI